MNKLDKDKVRSVAENDDWICYLTQWGVCGAAFLLHVWFLVMFGYYSIREPFLFNIGSVTLYTVFLMSLAIHKYKKQDVITAVSATEIIVHQLMCIYFLGPDAGFQQFLIPTAAYMFLYITESKRMQVIYTAIATVSVIAYALASVFSRDIVPAYSIPDFIEEITYSVNTISAFAILIAIVWVLSTLRRRSTWVAVQKTAQLEQMDKKKTELLNMMGHEIRTPLNAVIGMAEMSLREDLSDKVRNNLEYVCHSGKKLVNLVNNMLDLSRLDSGHLSLNEEDYSPKELIEDVTGLLELSAKEKHLSLRVETEGNLPDCLWGDAGKIRQIMTNLLGNAIKFTKEGGIVLRTKCESEGDICRITFEVEDTGIGIRKEAQARVFDVYEQLDVKGAAQTGSGLGLPISRGLAELLGGTLQVESVYGKGSRFYFTISQKILTGVTARKTETISKEFKAPGAKVLVVDDNKANLHVALEYLKTFDICVDLADCGEDAVEMADENAYDLIFMDWMMPQMDGLETTRQIRDLESGKYENIPIIALTANNDDSYRRTILESGCNDVLLKPCGAAAFSGVLQRWLPKELTTT